MYMYTMILLVLEVSLGLFYFNEFVYQHALPPNFPTCNYSYLRLCACDCHLGCAQKRLFEISMRAIALIAYIWSLK